MTTEGKEKPEGKDRENLFQGVAEMMKAWGDVQRTWLQTVMDAATKAAEGLRSAGAAGGPATAWMEVWSKSFDDLITRLRQIAPGGPAGDVYEKMLSAQAAYLRVLRWWGDALVQSRSGALSDPKALVDLWGRSYKEFLTSIVAPPFAEPLRAWWSGVQPAAMPVPLGDYAQAMVQMGKQWMDFVAKMGERAGEMLRGELKPEAGREMYESWLRAYEETLGRLFKVPTIGPARQMIDRHLRGLDAYMKYQAALADFYGKMVQPGMEALTELANKAQDLAQGPLTADTFEKFYQLLLKTVEQRFAELFKSPPFLTALEHTLHSSLDFYAQMNAILEEQLKGTPIVTRRELDEVLKELHELRKEVRQLKRS